LCKIPGNFSEKVRGKNDFFGNTSGKLSKNFPEKFFSKNSENISQNSVKTLKSVIAGMHKSSYLRDHFIEKINRIL
jgi:hypothetical protein